MIIIAIYLERYRSGHNEAVLKTVCPKGRVGSNPTLSALRGSLKELPFCITGSFFTGRSSLDTGYQKENADLKFIERRDGKIMEQEFQKLANFRDLGGLKGADGKAVRKKRLLCSGELSKVTEDDIKTLKECYHLYNIVDLRTKNERNSAPDIEIPGTVYHALDFFQGEDDGQATGSAEQLQQMQSKEQVDRKMKQLYASFVVSAGARQKMYELLQLLLNTEEGSTLIHCFAGKDRTGISAAAILTVLGVSKDDIAADYLKTNQLRKKRE